MAELVFVDASGTMEQATFAELEHDAKKRRTRRELFLEKMDGLIPWKQPGRLSSRSIRRRGAVVDRTRWE